jgi:fructose-1,6-bisphosphatase
MTGHFWTSFEKQAAIKPGPALNYKAMQAAELLKKRAKSGGTFNYAAMAKAPKPKAMAVVEKTPQQILEERAKHLAQGGTPVSEFKKAL